MKPNANVRIIVLASLLALVLASDMGVLFSHWSKEKKLEDTRHYIASLANQISSNSRPMNEEAQSLAQQIFADPALQSEFSHELLRLYTQVKGKDFLLVYNTGGFGGTSLQLDPEWQTVLRGIQLKLEELGYTSIVIEHPRGEYSLAGFVGEVRELTTSYASKAPVLAAKIAFLTGYDSHLRVIITGRSLGAQFSHEVKETLESSSRVYSIEAGQFWWYRKPSSSQTLLINDNGVTPDSLSHGEVLQILRANLPHLPRTYKPSGGSIKIGPYFFRVPGHEYTWGLPGVQAQITNFVEENFERK